MSVQTESRKAFRELIDLLNEVDARWASSEWNLQSADDVVGAHRAALHLLEGALVGHLESDPRRPVFRRIVTPTRKFSGDNADAIYFDAPVSADHSYIVRGSMGGAVYFSMTAERGSDGGGVAGKTGGVVNDETLDLGPDGRFEIRVGGPPQERNWLALLPDATRITTRHYYEEETAVAADPTREPVLSIECTDAAAAPPAPDDASVAASIRRVAQVVRTRTLDQPPMVDAEQPAFVSKIPNQFPKPVKPGDFGLAAFDAAYSMAPYVIGPDQALVMTGRWPACRCANVTLWNRHLQSYDYANRQVSLNRKQTRLEADGSFRMVIAHRDPGVPNWIDTEERPFGLVFWRFMLPDGEIETPQARVVPFAEIAQG